VRNVSTTVKDLKVEVTTVEEGREYEIEADAA